MTARKIVGALPSRDRQKHTKAQDDTSSTSPRLSPNEKIPADHDAEWAGINRDFSHIDEKKVLRKMDLRLIPMLALLYLLSFLDRGNIGNAKIEGLVPDLNMTEPQYNWTCM